MQLDEDIGIMKDLMENLQKYKLSTIPSTVYYIPEFITETEENALIARIYDVPKPKWTQLLNRRLQNWGGIPHPKGMIAEPIPDWLQEYLNRINSLDLMNGKVPNHILANEYLSGQGIMPHTDGPLFYPTITTVSCGSHTVIHFTKKTENQTENEEKHSILLEKRSLLIVQDDFYENYLHGIDDVTADSVSQDLANFHKCSESYEIGQTLKRQTRISLTIRHVPKTTRIKIKT
ncbi:putative RNA/DNA demethylase ALKBH6 isoform X2 [Arctopsyche grandis]|uniref:putative RNA/DNA demethylase ALKBH6 isoform X2 n=1 Tax=Arctopsyche grandis TaxID=121162 RepID=UPI00406D8C63